MNYSQNQISLANFYFDFLKNLNNESKRELISMLSESILEPKTSKGKSLKSLFGAYSSQETAEEIISSIRKSRVQSRKIEML